MSEHDDDQPLTFLKVGSLLPNMGLLPYEGECDDHGKSVVHVHPAQPNKAWFCIACHELAAKQAAHDKWVQEIATGLLEDAQIPARYRGQRFPATSKPMRDMRLVVKAFRDHIAKGQDWASLILYGETGTGKTLVASELAEAVINTLGFTVRFCTANEMVAEIQEAYGVYGKTEKGEIDRFGRYRLLIIDEVDKAEDRKNARLLLEEVMNRRYNNRLPVVVISNQPFQDMNQFVGARVTSRLHENAFVCAFTWQDFRKTQLPAGA